MLWINPLVIWIRNLIWILSDRQEDVLIKKKKRKKKGVVTSKFMSTKTSTMTLSLNRQAGWWGTYRSASNWLIQLSAGTATNTDLKPSTPLSLQVWLRLLPLVWRTPVCQSSPALDSKEKRSDHRPHPTWEMWHGQSHLVFTICVCCTYVQIYHSGHKYDRGTGDTGEELSHVLNRELERFYWWP